MAAFVNGFSSASGDGFSSMQSTTLLYETTSEAKSTSSKSFGSLMDESLRRLTTIDAFLDYIATERLRRMPHRGSKWDSVLAYAAFFASQIELFANATVNFTSHSQEAARILWSNLYILLEMGPGHVNTIERLFILYYSIGIRLESLVRYSDLFASSAEAQKALSVVLSQTVQLVTETASQFGHSSQVSPEILSEEIHRNYGILIENTFAACEQVFNVLWEASIKLDSKDTKVDIDSIRAFLSPSDRVVKELSSNRLGTKARRIEHSCEWMYSHLSSFVRSKDSMLVVQGKPGSGKSFLAEWVAERLQRIEDTKLYHDILFFSIDSSVRTQRSVSDVVKGLLLQLIDRNVTNISFYLALCEAMEASLQLQPTEEIENLLWTAMNLGLLNVSRTMIIVDGIDHLIGEESASHRLLERLSHLTNASVNLKAVTLLRPLSRAAPHHSRSLVIDQDLISNDIFAFIRSQFGSTVQLRSIKETEKDTIIRQITSAAKGSYLIPILSLELLKRENTIAGMLKILDDLPNTVEDALKRVETLIDLHNTDTRSLLAWLLAAQRPLRIHHELKPFFETDLSHVKQKERYSDITQDIINHVGPIVNITNGIVRFKHDSIRTYFETLAEQVTDYSNKSNFPFMLKEAHYDLTARCLAYIKLFVTRRVDPSTSPLKRDVLSKYYVQYPGLEYCAAYWTIHFRQSPMYNPNTNHEMVPAFKRCFPDSTLLPLVEGSILGFDTPLYELSFQIRQNILGPDTAPVLQTTINVARGFERISDYPRARTYYTQAYQLTQTLYGEHSDTLIDIATSYLKHTTTDRPITQWDDEAMQHETMLKSLIRHYKLNYGVSYTPTVKYTRMLAQIYTDTKQFDLAVPYWRDVHDAHIQWYGETDSETTSVYHALENAVKNSTQEKDIRTSTSGRYDTSRNVATVTTENQLADMVSYYEKRKEHGKAESLLVDEWQAASTAVTSSEDSSSQKRQLDATKKYVEYLKRQNRTEEAQTILEGVATEYQGRALSSDTAASSFQGLAEEMRSLNMVKTARSVLSSLSSYFQSTGQTSSQQAESVLRSFKETTEDLVRTVTTTTTTTKTTSSTSADSTTATGQRSIENVSDASTLSEVLDSLTSVTSITSSSEFKSIVTASDSLSLTYLREQQWTKAYSVCSKALSKLWPSLITRNGPTRLPSQYQKDAVVLAHRMAECMWAKRQIEKTEDIYLTVFKATKAAVKWTDELFIAAADRLTDFYEQTYQFHKFIRTYREIYDDQKIHLGPKNKQTIRTAYRIANFCYAQGNHKDAEPFYRSIYETLVVTDDNFPVEAVDAAKNLLIVYDQDGRWDAALELCKTLWKFFTTFGGSVSKFPEDFVEKIYTTYFYVLEEVKTASFEELYELTKTYKDSCQKFFGEKNELTLKAVLQFGQVCERKEEHHETSREMFEEARKHAENSQTTTTTSSTVMQTLAIAKESLARHYTKQATSSEAASNLVNEQYTSTRSSYGVADSRSLDRLDQLVEYNSKQNKTEATQKSLNLLQTAVVDSIKKEQNSQTLTKSATKLAEMYQKTGQTDTALKINHEIRRQVVTGDYKSRGEFGFSLEGTDHASNTFLVAFTQALLGGSSTSSFSEIMAELMNEKLLYQDYARVKSQNASFEVIFDQGLRLCLFYLSKDDAEDYNRIWIELFDLFATYMGVATTNQVLHEFFEIVITQARVGNFDIATEQIGVANVLKKMQESKFQDACDFAFFVYKYTLLQSGWETERKVEVGFILTLHLMGRSNTPKCTDQTIRMALVETSRIILSASLATARKLKMRFITMRKAQLNEIVEILGEQHNYDDLEWLLSELWHSRFNQSSWDSATIVRIGRRLVEVRFAAERYDSAIHLAEDITYNVRRVWGANDPITIQMFNLMAELYGAMGKHDAAIAVHEEMLRLTLGVAEEEEEDENIREQAANIAAQHLDLLKRAYQRNRGWGEKDSTIYKELYYQLSNHFSSHSSFRSVQNMEYWNADEQTDNIGIWKKPESFKFFVADTARHRNHLRKTSGLYANSVSGLKSPSVRSVSSFSLRE